MSAVRGHAFGIDVTAPFELPGLNPPDGLGGRPRVEIATGGTWTGTGPERLVEELDAGGEVFLAVDRNADGGHRVDAPGHGTHVVAPDGSRIDLDTPAPRLAGQRLLFAQTLPIAALLQGAELFHASAVATPRGAVAMTGPPGAGKSSIATHLVAGGAAFLTDDVLAVSSPAGSDGGLVAHAGPRLARVDAGELAGIEVVRRGRLGRAIGALDKLHLRPRPGPGSQPLRAFLLLERGADVPEPEVVASADGDAPLLLGSAFTAHVQTPERLTRRLDACAQLIDRGIVHRVRVPEGASAAAVAAAIEAWLDRG